MEITIDVSSEIQEDTIKTIIEEYFTGTSPNLNINNQQFVFKGAFINGTISRTELRI